MKPRIVIASAGAAILIAAGTGAYFFGNSVGAESADDAGADGAQAQSGPPPAPVVVAKAQERLMAPKAEAPGSVVSTRDSLVAAATSGVIDWVSEVGAEVEEGDVVARIDPADAKLNHDNTLADLARLRARANYLDSLYKRYVGLGVDAGESEATLDEMRSNRDAALQSVTQAEVALRRAKINLERTNVTAPFAGRVVSQETQIGEYANPGAGLVRLVDTRKLEVTARAPAALARNISAGDMIVVANGVDSVDAIVRAVVPVGDALSRMLELRLELPTASWYIGAAVRVDLPNGEARRVIAVPRDALVLRANRTSVYVIDDDNMAVQHDVELGVASGNFIEVIGNLKAGDAVVIRGGERLRDGQSVTISELPQQPSV